MRLARRLPTILAILGAIVVGVVVVAAIHFGAAYEDHLERLRAEGAPLLPADLATPPIPDAENGALLLADAQAWLNTHNDEYRTPDSSGPPSGLLEVPEPAVVADWTEQDWIRVEHYLDSLAPYFALLERAAAAPGWRLDLEWDRGPEMEMPSIFQLMEAWNNLAYRIHFDRRAEGRTDRAVETILLALDLGQRCEIPFLLGHLVQRTLQIAGTRMVLDVARNPEFDATRVRALLDGRFAALLPPLGPDAGTLIEERTFGLWMFQALADGRNLNLGGEEFHAPWYTRTFFQRDGARYLELMADAIDACGVPPEEMFTLADRFDKEVEDLGRTYLITSLMSGIVPNFFRESGRIHAGVRLTRVVLALLEQKQQTGDWPETLAELDGRFAGGLPLDPYGRGPFQYERREGHVRVWANSPLAQEEDIEEVFPLLVENLLAWSSDPLR